MKFVYSANEGQVLWTTGSRVPMHVNQVWFADDPFVLARPDLFSATPLVVHSTEGRDAPPHTPLDLAAAGAAEARPARGRRA